jgi:Cu-processing system permease protein
VNSIGKFVILDILKNKIVLAYTLFLAVLSWSVFGLEDNGSKGLLTLLNIVLLTVPLVSVIFSTIYVYNSSEFIELLLSQPIRRSRIWRSIFSGLTLSLVFAFLIGSALPIIILAPDIVGIMMIVVGCLVTAIFVSLAMLASIITRDKAKGIGIAVMLWLFYGLLFDGLILFLLFQFADYPIEKAMVAVTVLNPIDLGRIMILLHLDVSAMMGYTGAIFKDFFGTSTGTIAAFSILLLWTIIPFGISIRKFGRKDL